MSRREEKKQRDGEEQREVYPISEATMEELNSPGVSTTIHTVALLDLIPPERANQLCHDGGRFFLFGRGSLARSVLTDLKSHIQTLPDGHTLLLDLGGLRLANDFVEVVIQNLFYSDVPGGRFTIGKHVVLANPDEATLVAIERSLESERDNAMVILDTNKEPWQLAYMGSIEPYFWKLLDYIRLQEIVTSKEVAEHLSARLGDATSRLRVLHDAGFVRRSLTAGQRSFQYRYYHPYHDIDPNFMPPELYRYKCPRLPRATIAAESGDDLTTDDEDNVLLARLSIFVGGFCLEDAQSVCIGGPITSDSIAIGLERLVAVSRVMAETRPGVDATWFSVPENQARSGNEMLLPKEREALWERYAIHYQHLAEVANRNLHGPEPGKWLDRLYAERHNLTAVIDGLTDRGRISDALYMATMLSTFWINRSNRKEALNYFTSLLSKTETTIPTNVRASALLAAADIAHLLGYTDQANDFIAQRETVLGK